MATRFYVDSLASAKYPKILFKALPERMGFSGFADVFGNFLPVAETGAKRGHLYIKVQAVWQGGNHIYTSAHLKKAITHAKRFNALAAKFPDTEFDFSPFCEYAPGSIPFEEVADTILPLIPHMRIISTPMQVSQFLENYRNEIHHGYQGKFDYQVSHDGIVTGNGSLDTNIQLFKDKHVDAKKFGGWCGQLNLKKNANEVSDIASRNCKPTVQLIESLVHILTNQKMPTHLPQGWLYKSHAEQKKDIDPRSGKPVVLTPEGKACKTVVLVVQATNKKYVLTDGGFTRNEDNKPNFKPRQSWRCNTWGYQIGRLCDIKADGKLIGTVDAGFRENEYRDE